MQMMGIEEIRSEADGGSNADADMIGYASLSSISFEYGD